MVRWWPAEDVETTTSPKGAHRRFRRAEELPGDGCREKKRNTILNSGDSPNADGHIGLSIHIVANSWSVITIRYVIIGLSFLFNSGLTASPNTQPQEKKTLESRFWGL